MENIEQCYLNIIFNVLVVGSRLGYLCMAIYYLYRRNFITINFNTTVTCSDVM